MATLSVFVLCASELMFLETSALTGENVEEAFVQCARKILNKIESGKIHLIPLILLESLSVHSNKLLYEVQSEEATCALPSLNNLSVLSSTSYF